MILYEKFHSIHSKMAKFNCINNVNGFILGKNSGTVPVTRWLQLRFDLDLTAIRTPFDSHSIQFDSALRPFYVMAYLFWAAALRPR